VDHIVLLNDLWIRAIPSGLGRIEAKMIEEVEEMTLHLWSGQSEKEEYTRRGARNNGKKTDVYAVIQVAGIGTGKERPEKQ
jgi:hypothetical protein